MSSSFQVGDLVWAKMKGFSTWPGRVSIPIPSLGLKSPRNMSQLQCVYFFGSNNYGWVKEKNMKPYQEFKEKMMMYCNTSAFKAAISDIDSYIENPESFGVIDGPVQNGVEENEALKDAESEQSEEINLPNNASESFGVIDAPVQYGVEENGVLKENAVNGEIEQKRLSEETNLPNNSSEIRDVILRLHKIRYYKCDECPRMYISQDKLDEHKKIHVHIFSSYVLLDRAEVLRYKCRTCRRGFQQLRECRLHELIHVQEDIHKRKFALNDDHGNIVKPYKCEDCGVRFALSSTLSAHSIVHEPFPYLCDCGIGFFREIDFKAHRQTVHPNVRKWIPKTNYKKPKPKLEFVVKKRARQPSPVTDSLDESIDSPDEIKVEPVDRAWRYKVKNKSNRKRGKRKMTKRNPTEKKSMIKLKNEFGQEIDILKNEIGRFACPRCDKHFISRHYVVKHFRVHTGEKPFACEHCDKRFSSKATRDNHLAIHGLGRSTYVCDYCDAGYCSKNSLELHIINQHLGYRPYICKVCKKGFAQQLGLNNHLKIHEGVRNFICKYCKKGFLLAGALTLHERTHTGEKPYVCTYCEKSFSDPSAFQRHIRTHTGDKRYACKLCTMRFSDTSGLIAHKKRHIGDSERSKECDICKKKFYTNSELKNHVIAVHAFIRKYECSECDKKCSSKANLQAHILRMHGVLFCDKCRRSFSSDKALQKHIAKDCPKRKKKKKVRKEIKEESFEVPVSYSTKMEIHKRKYALNDDNGNIVKPYECEDCGVRFALSSTLSAHSILHKPFPYLCDCGIGFFREMDFEAHRQTVHPNVRKWIPKTNYKGPKPKLEFVVKKRARQPSPVTDSLDESIDSPDEIKVKPVDRAWRSKVKKNKSDRKRGTRKITKMNPTENKSIIKLKNEYGEEIDILKNEIGRFACPRCDKHFRSRHNVVTHFRVHTGEKPFACEHCDKRFSLKSIYDSHLSVHGLGKRSYVCDYCDAGYSHKTRLELHITNQHLGYNYRPYVCKVCKKRFGHQLLLNRHLKTHEGIRNFICKYCKKGFLLAASLILHERTHTGEKPYVCTYCEKSFSDPSAFQRHIRTHTGDKRYACKLCTMRFSDASGLIAHKKRHIGDSERSKECDICKKKFYTNSELKNHVIAVHAFIRKYECSECDKKCSSKANLQGHILRMHGVMFCDKCRRSFSTDKALQKHIAKDCPKRKKKKKVRKEIKEESFEVPVSYSTKMEM